MSYVFVLTVDLTHNHCACLGVYNICDDLLMHARTKVFKLVSISHTVTYYTLVLYTRATQEYIGPDHCCTLSKYIDKMHYYNENSQTVEKQEII